MKNNIDKIKNQIEFLYGEVSRQKKDIEELNKLVLFLTKMIAIKNEEEEIEIL